MNEIHCKTEVGETISEYIGQASSVPDTIIIPLIQKRLQKGDCRTYGWVLEGFPKSSKQSYILKNQLFKPNMCVLLDSIDAKCVERTEFKRVDPVTGKCALAYIWICFRYKIQS